MVYHLKFASKSFCVPFHQSFYTYWTMRAATREHVWCKSLYKFNKFLLSSPLSLSSLVHRSQILSAYTLFMVKYQDSYPIKRIFVYMLCTNSHTFRQVITYLLTPWSTVPLEKLTGSAASQEIPPTFGTRRFLTVFTIARHLSLSW